MKWVKTVIDWLFESPSCRTTWGRQNVTSNYIQQHRLGKVVIPLWCLLCYDSRISPHIEFVQDLLQFHIDSPVPSANYSAQPTAVKKPQSLMLLLMINLLRCSCTNALLMVLVLILLHFYFLVSCFQVKSPIMWQDSCHEVVMYFES